MDNKRINAENFCSQKFPVILAVIFSKREARMSGINVKVPLSVNVVFWILLAFGLSHFYPLRIEAFLWLVVAVGLRFGLTLSWHLITIHCALSILSYGHFTIRSFVGPISSVIFPVPFYQVLGFGPLFVGLVSWLPSFAVMGVVPLAITVVLGRFLLASDAKKFFGLGSQKLKNQFFLVIFSLLILLSISEYRRRQMVAFYTSAIHEIQNGRNR